MTYDGLTLVSDSGQPHLGGNIAEGDPFTYAPRVWNYLIARFALRSVLDLGAGRAYSSAFFHRAGMQVISVDGLRSNCETAVYPTLHADLTKAPVYCKVDLVHCQEVVEHIEEQHLGNLLPSLACGNFIVMTHALPGQGGHHHVNLQSPEYWIGHLGAHGYRVLDEDTRRIRALAQQDGASYLEETGLVLTRKQA